MKKLIKFLLFFSIFSFLFAGQNQSKIVDKALFVSLDSKAKKQWMSDLFQTDEVWPLVNKLKFFDFLENELHLNELLVSYIKTSYSQRSNDAINYIFSFYDIYSLKNEGYLKISNEIKKMIPNEKLSLIYGRLSLDGSSISGIRSNSLQDASSKLTEFGLSDDVAEYIVSRSYMHKGKVVTPVTPDIWKFLPLSLKKFVLDKSLVLNEDRASIPIRLIVRSTDDIEFIVNKYVPLENRKSVKRFLNRKLYLNGSKRFSINLEDIMPAFIRKNLFSYSHKSGPNCFNSAICVNQGNNFVQEFTSESELRDEIYNNYFRILPSTNPEPGDLILYSSKDNRAVHAVTYIDDNLVFSKNGVSIFSPYIFTTNESIKKEYFKKEEFIVNRYRHKKNVCKSLLLKLLDV